MNKEFRNEVIKEIFGWVRLIVVTVVLALFFNFFVIVNAVIPSSSMEQTIMTGDRIIAFRLSYLIGQPKRHDIVILPDPDNPRGDLFIKRIVGLPGETVFIDEGVVLIQREGSQEFEPLDEPFLNSNDMPRNSHGPFTVPENSYFMMGDNRNNSSDSRHWNNPFIYEGDILGRAIFRYYPGLRIIR